MDEITAPDWLDDDAPKPWECDPDTPPAAVGKPSASNLLGYRCSDVGNADRLIALYGENLRHVDALGWLAWNGKYWQRDTIGTVQEAAKAAAARFREAAEQFASRANDDDTKAAAKKLLSFSAATENSARLSAMISLAASDPVVSRQLEDLDAHPYLCNVANGTVELRTGQLRAHSRADMLTVCAPASLEDWTRTAGPSTWSKFLDRILPDPDTQAFVQRCVGLSLIGEQRDHVVPFLFGGGQNGKGTMLRAIMAAIGKYGCAVPSDMLMERMSAPHAAQKAMLMGKRFAVADELPHNRDFDVAALKSLSGGDDIAAQFMRKDWFTFTPTHTLWLQGNDKPRIPGGDFGTWRRMRLIPFLVKIPDTEKDPDLDRKLAAERDIILRWAIDGAAEYMREGLGACPEVVAATAEYQSDSDVIGQFISDCCTLAPGAWISRLTLREAMAVWYADEGRKGVPGPALVKADLGKRGIKEHRETKSGPRGWLGIDLTYDRKEYMRRDAYGAGLPRGDRGPWHD